MSLFIFSGEVKYILRYHPSIYELLEHILKNKYSKEEITTNLKLRYMSSISKLDNDKDPNM